MFLNASCFIVRKNKGCRLFQSLPWIIDLLPSSKTKQSSRAVVQNTRTKTQWIFAKGFFFLNHLRDLKPPRLQPPRQSWNAKSVSLGHSGSG